MPGLYLGTNSASPVGTLVGGHGLVGPDGRQTELNDVLPVGGVVLVSATSDQIDRNLRALRGAVADGIEVVGIVYASANRPTTTPNDAVYFCQHTAKTPCSLASESDSAGTVIVVDSCGRVRWAGRLEEVAIATDIASSVLLSRSVPPGA
ncbi:MAG: hypothetical protein QGH20_03000 [Candidatus Latescibacteria bacterium]|nr:hypothetical protein [Candidatus Latescibacterota bacterium]